MVGFVDFPYFLRNSRSGCFLFCLVSRFGKNSICGQNSRCQDSSLRPHTNQRPLTLHPTTLHSPFPPNHTWPTPPRTHLLHPPPHTHTLDEKFLHLCSRNIPLRVRADTREGVCLTGLGIPNLGAFPITASVSLTHLPCLFACFNEAVSCVYAFFSTCLSTCVASSAWFVFGFVFITTFFSLSSFPSNSIHIFGTVLLLYTWHCHMSVLLFCLHVYWICILRVCM